MAGQANTKSVRWKPKEVLEETGTEAVRYESDIYSLAMCMIETKTHEIRPTRSPRGSWPQSCTWRASKCRARSGPPPRHSKSNLGGPLWNGRRLRGTSVPKG
ncbi:hypothetical protein PF008_g3576 [Phytophthora fragariae]|uniref:Protein kinase domain-containing protein n=1 Tax=Phytophthora fragariae TaxID=53985 RepID=A0A6G0SEJ0_9STRA|nr:hypothetical protein PF008_g3576 [Phytophthora fragariae]